MLMQRAPMQFCLLQAVDKEVVSLHCWLRAMVYLIQHPVPDSSSQRVHDTLEGG